MSGERCTNLFWKLHPKPKSVSELKIILGKAWENFLHKKALSWGFRNRLREYVKAAGRHFEHFTQKPPDFESATRATLANFAPKPIHHNALGLTVRHSFLNCMRGWDGRINGRFAIRNEASGESRTPKISRRRCCAKPASLMFTDAIELRFLNFSLFNC